MREGDRRMHPAQTELFERKAAKVWRTEAEGMDRGANIVAKSGEGQLHRARAAPDDIGAFDDLDRLAHLGKRNSGSQAIRSGSDDNRVQAAHRHILSAIAVDTTTILSTTRYGLATWVAT